MILSPQPKLHFTDQNGKPLAGGTLSTYTGSSTNPVQTYADYAGTVLNPVHITLDARGECQVFLNPSIVYIFVLKDMNGTEIYTVNGVTASGSGSSGSNISITSTDSSVTITSTVATDGSIVYNLSIQNQIDTINTAITSEANTRANADSTLQTNLNNEITSRWQADSNLQDQIDNIGSYTASAPITITDKVITHDPSGVQPGSYGDTSDSRVLAWGDSFKVNTNTIDKYGHVTSATETNLTLPTVEKLENNYFLGSYADATTFSTSPIVIPFTKIDGKNITYSDGLIVTSNIELFDLSFNLYGNFQDYATATDSRLISIGLYKDSVLYDVKIFNVNAFDNKIEINGNFKVKNTGSTYLIVASTDVGTFVLSNSTSSTNLRVNDETANPSLNASGSSEVYHTSSFTGNGTTDNPLTLVPASTTLLGGIKVGSNLSISSDGTLNATGGEDSYEVKVEASGTAGYLSDKIETTAPIQHRIDNDKVLIYQDPVEASPLMMLSTPSIDNVLSTLNVATNGTQQGSWIAIQAHAFTVPNYFVPTSTDIWNYVNINTQGSTAETVHFVGIYAYDLTTDEIHLVAMSVNGASHDNTSIGLAQLETGYINTTSPYNIIKPGIIYYAFHACDQTALTVAGNTSNTFNLNRPYPSFILYNLRNGLTVNDFVTNYGTVSMTSSTISHQESSGKRFVSVRHIS